jgi:hypothetical protein
LRSSTIVLLLALLVGLLPGAASAKVFLSKQEAIAFAFPGAERVDSRSILLDDAQAAAVEEHAHAPLESRLVTLYTGYVGDEVTGYALIDIHTVRTLPEAFLVVLSPDGVVRNVRMLAFYEPPEYCPPEGWLAHFEDATLRPELSLGGDIHGIAGSTLSSRAVTSGIRRALALHAVLVGGATAQASGGAEAPATGLGGG